MDHKVSGNVKGELPPIIVKVDTTPTLTSEQVVSICHQQHEDSAKIEKCITDLSVFVIETP